MDKGLIDTTRYMGCPECDSKMLVHGVFSDGTWSNKLTGYTPQKGELVRNHSMVCSICDFEQYS